MSSTGSSGDQATGEFCVCYKYESSKWLIYIKYLSEPKEDKSMRLPDALVGPSLTPEQSSHEQVTTTNATQLDEKTLKIQIEASFSACYGTDVPDVLNGRNLMIPVKIFEGHWKLLNEMPLEEPKKAFLSVVFDIIMQRLLRTAGGATSSIELSPFKLEIVNGSMQSGGIATEEKIAMTLMEWILKAPDERESRREPPGSAIRVGDHLMEFKEKIDQSDRVVHYKLVASDKPGSIRLPQHLVNRNRCFNLSFWLVIRFISFEDILESMRTKIRECLEVYYKTQGPVVLMSPNPGKARKHTLIEVPVHVNHAGILPTCLYIQPVQFSFTTAVAEFYEKKYLNERIEMMKDLDATDDHSIMDLPGLG